MARPRKIGSLEPFEDFVPSEYVGPRAAKAWRPIFRKEAELQALLHQNVESVLDALGLPPALNVMKEARAVEGLRGSAGDNTRMDVLVDHGSGQMTVFEVKRVKDSHGINMAIAQLLMYEQVLMDCRGAESVNLVALIDGGLYEAAFRMCRRRRLPIRFLVARGEGYSIVDLREEGATL